MNIKKYLPIVIAIVIVIASALIWYGVKTGWQMKVGIPGLGQQKEGGQPAGAEPTGLPTVQGGTRDEISKDIKTPEPGTTPTNPDVAVPKSAAELKGGQASASLRDFEIKAEGGKFTPSTIVVDELDIVTINLTAVDKKYNIFFPDFGVYREAAKSQTVKFQFQTYPFGQYKFYCKDICGAETAGTLIVNKKQ